MVAVNRSVARKSACATFVEAMTSSFNLFIVCDFAAQGLTSAGIPSKIFRALKPVPAEVNDERREKNDAEQEPEQEEEWEERKFSQPLPETSDTCGGRRVGPAVQKGRHLFPTELVTDRLKKNREPDATDHQAEYQQNHTANHTRIAARLASKSSLSAATDLRVSTAEQSKD